MYKYLLIIAVLVIASCGGGGEVVTPPPNDNPPPVENNVPLPGSQPDPNDMIEYISGEWKLTESAASPLPGGWPQSIELDIWWLSYWVAQMDLPDPLPELMGDSTMKDVQLYRADERDTADSFMYDTRKHIIDLQVFPQQLLHKVYLRYPTPGDENSYSEVIYDAQWLRN